MNAARMSARTTSLAALAVAAAALLPGCGGDEGARSGEGANQTASARAGLEDLLRRVPGAASDIEAMDWRRGLKELGLRKPFVMVGSPVTGAELRFVLAMVGSAPYLAKREGLRFVQAIDHDLVTASVSLDVQADDVALVATSAPHQGVVERLRSAGYESVDGALYSPRGADPEAPYSTVGVADGLLAIGPAGPVKRALARPRPSRKAGLSIRLLDHVEGANRAVTPVDETYGRTCVRAVAASQDFPRHGGDFAFRVAGRASARRVRLTPARLRRSPAKRHFEDLRISSIRVRGSVVRMSIAPRDPLDEDAATWLPLRFSPAEDASALYDCP